MVKKLPAVRKDVKNAPLLCQEICSGVTFKLNMIKIKQAAEFPYFQATNTVLPPLKRVTKCARQGAVCKWNNLYVYSK